MRTGEQQCFNVMFFMLIMQMEGAALGIVQQTEDNHGFGPYMQLHKRFNPESRGRAQRGSRTFCPSNSAMSQDVP